VSRAERVEERVRASRDAGALMPFDRLRSTFGLSPTEQRALWVLIAVEVDANMRQLMRYMVNESARIYPDVGMVESLVYSSAATRELLIQELSPDSRLFRYRLIENVGSRRQIEDAPYLLRNLRVNRRVIEAVHGLVRLDREVAGVAQLVEQPPPFATLILDEQIKREVTELLRAGMVGAAMGRGSPAVMLAGHEGSGRKSLVYGAAHALDSKVLRVRCSDLSRDPNELLRQAQALTREAVMFRAVLLLDGVEALAADAEMGRPDRAKYLDHILNEYPGPVAATCPRGDSRPVRFERGIVLIELGVPAETARVELWKRALGTAATGDSADRAASRYPITGGIIQRSADSALALSRARGETVITPEDLHAGVRSTLDVKLSTLGVRLQWLQRWDDLVLPQDAIEEIREFIARVRHRRRVYEDWGFARKVAKGLGLSALFSGPPGTGKTMVAGIIADELALDLYQIDLSRIVSKYVGETEKNLAGLFDAAEAGHAILLFDEADSLFAKRTEVKSSVDRYANLEVNYLLQRMESFNGITILTTNLDSSIDDAFRRRISFHVDFPIPEPEDRERLWQTMLPKEAQVEPGIDYRALADRYEMTGGYIRNAVLRAAFLAADEQGGISMRHLVRAANLEYTGMGKVISHTGAPATSPPRTPRAR
jgi:predicted nucleic acid-binding protein